MKTVTVFLFLLFVVCILPLSCKSNDTYTNFTVNVTHPDSAVNGKEVILEIDSDLLPSPLLLRDTFTGNSAIFETGIPDQYIEGDETKIDIIASLAGMPENDHIDLQLYKSIPTAYTAYYPFLLTKTQYTGIKSMVRQRFILERDGNRSFNVEFPGSFNIQIEYENYPPEIRWDAFPNSEVVHYRYVVLINDDKMEFTSDWKIGNTTWMIAAKSNSTQNTSAKIYSDAFRFHTGYGAPGLVMPPNMLPGDVFKIEVYADIINMQFREIFMDSVTIYYGGIK